MNNEILLFKFWSGWENAHDKAEYIKKLALIDNEPDGENKELLSRMFNSYLEDLYEYMVTKYHIEV
jgi:hypothetical protein